MSKPELMYFDGPGRANVARLAFVAGGVAFTDTRFSFETWPAVKSDPTSVPSRLFDQMPCLEHDGLLLGESVAVATYAAELGLYQKRAPSSKERALDAMVTCSNEGLRKAMYKCLFGSDESKARGKEALPRDVAAVLEGLERLYARKTTAGPFLTSDGGPSLADLAVYDNIESPFPGLKALGVDLSPYPKLVACAAAVEQIPEIQQFKANGWK